MNETLNWILVERTHKVQYVSIQIKAIDALNFLGCDFNSFDKRIIREPQIKHLLIVFNKKSKLIAIDFLEVSKVVIGVWN